MSHEYQAALRYLYSLHRFGIKLGLSNIRNLLRALDEPQTKVPVIHIAGTNGKGSVAALIQSVLKCHGYRAGLFTSPHLEDFRERIRINDEYISREEVARYCEQIRAVLGSNAADFSPSGCVTFFEFVTAMAYSYFVDQEVDYALMEVGLGGRLDSTNVVNPLLSIITDIGYDHTDRLGNTLKQIAGEKSGIIKKGVPVVTSHQKAEALAVIESAAGRCGSPLTVGGKDYRWERRETGLSGQTFDYSERGRGFNGLRIRLLGEHQVRNAALAAASCLRLEGSGLRMKEEELRAGLRNARWPGRLEVVSAEPYVILDGAHNPAAAAVLAKAVKELFPCAGPVLVFGAMGDKDLSGILAELLPIASRVVLTRPDMKRSADIDTLKELVSHFGKEAVTAETVPQALDAALEGACREDVILVTGSLFTVGEARGCLRFHNA